MSARSRTDCPYGHPTVGQPFSGGEEVYCETCGEVYLIRHCLEGCDTCLGRGCMWCDGSTPEEIWVRVQDLFEEARDEA